jgi:hypothetical protein
MLRPVHDLQQLSLAASDGNIGEVTDVYFDDENWAIRYLVVDAGTWLSSRKVLISPISAGKPDWLAKTLSVSLTREQVKSSPAIDTNLPVSRQYEARYSGYYLYPYYWGGTGLWGAGMTPGVLISGYGSAGKLPVMDVQVQEASARLAFAKSQEEGNHLRSCAAVKGYQIHANDGDIGHIQGWLVDEETWAIRYIIVQTSNWWAGHAVLIVPQWITNVSWIASTVSVDLSRQAIQDAPVYNPNATLDRTQEALIYEHYGRWGYWEDKA